MVEERFKLKGENIPLIGLLKIVGVASTGGHASMLVTEGLVQLNGNVETQKRKKIIKGDVIRVEGMSITID